MLLGCFTTVSQHTAGTDRVDSRWTTASDSVPQILDIQKTEKPSQSRELAAGGARFDLAMFPLNSSNAVNVSHPTTSFDTAAALFGNTYVTDDLSEVVGTSAGGQGQVKDVGIGNNIGTGKGDGQGGDFFGIRPQGQRFVYVIDCSGSMNYHHSSEAKTRFRRVKFELLRSIGMMHPSQKFFMVFFNDEMFAMPAPSLQSALPARKKCYLNWMANVKALGETDPIEAVTLALRLQPDVIYFLTDGNFTAKTEKQLMALRQSRATLHTFAFAAETSEEIQQGVDLLKSDKPRQARRLLKSPDYRTARTIVRAERVLKKLAVKHRGEYHLLP